VQIVTLYGVFVLNAYQYL